MFDVGDASNFFDDAGEHGASTVTNILNLQPDSPQSHSDAEKTMTSLRVAVPLWRKNFTLSTDRVRTLPRRSPRRSGVVGDV